MLRRIGTETKDVHARRYAGANAGRRIFDDGTRRRIDAHLAGGVQKHIRGRLWSLNVNDAEAPLAESRQQARFSERQAHLVMVSA